MTRRRLIVLAGAALTLLIVGPMLALLAAETLRAPESSTDAAATPVVHASAAAAEPVRPEDITWVYAPPPVPGAVDSYVLQAGTLGADEPLVDRDVRWDADLAADLTRLPPIAGPVGGDVLYVSDDGTASRVHRIPIMPDGEDVQLAELGEVIWTMVASPNGEALYAAIAAREDTERDLGVVRVRLDGSGAVDPVMPPADLSRAEITRIAFLGFNVQLALSDDGRHLVRRACRGSDGCVVEVTSLEDAVTNRLPDADLMGVAGEFVVQRSCVDRPCGVIVTNLRTGDSIAVEDDLVGIVVSHRGGPLLLRSDTDVGRTSTIVAVDLASGRRGILYRAPPGSFVAVGAHAHLTLAVPEGLVHVTEATPVDEPTGAVVEMRHRELLVSLDGGAVLEIPPAAYRPPPGFEVQG